MAVRDAGRYTAVRAGDPIPAAGLRVTVVTASGEAIAGALPGAGHPTVSCGTKKSLNPDSGENAHSIGTAAVLSDDPPHRRAVGYAAVAGRNLSP